MRFGDLLAIVGDEPLFETGLLLAGDVCPSDVRRQLSRWTRAGKLVQLRRGLYALGAPYEKVSPHPYVVANRLVSGSYVSLETALGHYGMIPEHVPVTASVTTGRPGRRENSLGSFDYQHVSRRLFWGFTRAQVAPGQAAFLARPEKALIDLVYLRPQGDCGEWLQQLRLQNLGTLDMDWLRRSVARTARPKLLRMLANLEVMVRSEREEYETL